MKVAGHGFGRMQGHGNRYSHKINDIILDYMIECQLEKGVPKRKPIPHKLSDIADIVRKRMNKRGVSWDTIRGHLEELVAKRILLEDPKRGSNNERYFLLSRVRLSSRGTLHVQIKR
jgi:hypothetical protein